MSADRFVIQVGDRCAVEGHGDRVIEEIAICLRPHVDPAGEQYFVKVGAVEVGEFCPPFVVQLEGGGWAYSHQVREVVERAEE